MLDNYRDRLRNAIDEANWSLIESLCFENPGGFFSSLDTRKMGKKRISTLNSMAHVSLSKRKNIQYVSLERLIMEQIKLGTNKAKATKKEETTVKSNLLEAYKASLRE